MNPSRESFPSAVEEQASLWAARLDRGHLSAREQKQLESWLAKDPVHWRCWREYVNLFGELEVFLPQYAARSRMSNGENMRVSWLSRGWWFAGSVAVAASIAFVSWVAVRPHIELIQATAQRRTITLEDGTRAEINAGSRMEIRFDQSSRRVRLQHGEAIFSVTHDESRPFSVETPGGTVRDIGTVFNVRSNGGDKLEVTVMEGSVEVMPAAPHAIELEAGNGISPMGDQRRVTLIAGQQLSLPAVARTPVRVLLPETVEDVVAWRNGGVILDGVPLRETLLRFSRVHGVSITASPGVEGLHLGGRFSVEDLDGFLEALEKALPVRVVRSADGSLWIGEQ